MAPRHPRLGKRPRSDSPSLGSGGRSSPWLAGLWGFAQVCSWWDEETPRTPELGLRLSL